MRASFFLALVCSSLAAPDFNYNRCDKTKGPSGWGGQCKGSQNTPVNLCGAVAFPTNNPAPDLKLGMSSNWNALRNVQILNNGYTIQINIPDNLPTMNVGTLSNLVQRGSGANVQTTWTLAQMHVHFGRDGKLNEGSEHYQQGKAYPMEAHFVHYNNAVGNSLTAAASSGKPESLLVVGVFLDIGTDNSVLAAMANGIPNAKETPANLATPVMLTDLFDGTGDYYSYGGGLTTPGCNEVVTWIVMKNSKTISEATLNKYKAASITPATSLTQKFILQASGTQGDQGTFRPLQAINGRPIYYTGGASAACTTVTEPAWVCTPSAGLLQNPSLLLSLLALGFWFSQM